MGNVTILFNGTVNTACSSSFDESTGWRHPTTEFCLFLRTRHTHCLSPAAAPLIYRERFVLLTSSSVYCRRFSGGVWHGAGPCAPYDGQQQHSHCVALPARQQGIFLLPADGQRRPTVIYYRIFESIRRMNIWFILVLLLIVRRTRSAADRDKDSVTATQVI